MKKMILLLSLIISSSLFAETTHQVADEVQISIGEEKATEFHFYNFGTIPVGMRRSTTYTLTNRMNYPIVLANTFLNGPGFESFHNCWFELFPGQRCSFTLTFAPRYSGYNNGMYVMNFYQGYSIQINLSGNAFLR